MLRTNPTALYRHVALLADAGLLRVTLDEGTGGSAAKRYQAVATRIEISSDATASSDAKSQPRPAAVARFLIGLTGETPEQFVKRIASGAAPGCRNEDATHEVEILIRKL